MRLLLVLAQPSVVAQPSEGAFDDSTPFEHSKSGHGWWFDAFRVVSRASRWQDHFHAPAQVLLDPGDQAAAIARVGPQVLELGKARRRCFQQGHGPVAIRHVGGVHLRAKHQPRAIYERVALAPIDLFAAVVAVHTTTVRGLGTLAVDDGRRWFG